TCLAQGNVILIRAVDKAGKLQQIGAIRVSAAVNLVNGNIPADIDRRVAQECGLQEGVLYSSRPGVGIAGIAAAECPPASTDRDGAGGAAVQDVGGGGAR